MRLLIKNFSKFTFLRRIQAIIFIAFIILFVCLTSGIIATPLQIIISSNNVNNSTKKWNYDWTVDWSSYDNGFTYEYFEDKNSDLFNKLTKPLLNLDYQDPETKQTLNEQLKNYYSNHPNIANSYDDFLGSFILNNVFSFKYLYKNHSVLIPAETEKTYLLKDVVNQPWVDMIYNNYGQIYNFVNQDLAIKFGSEILIDSSFNYNYSWGDFLHSQRIYHLVPININKSDNVVMTKSDIFSIANLQDNEILINDKFAKRNNIKINDEIQINNFQKLNNWPIEIV